MPGMAPDALNDFYASIEPLTAGGVPSAGVRVPTLQPRMHICSLKVRPTNFDFLCITFATMQSSKSTGVYGISRQHKFSLGLELPLPDLVNASVAFRKNGSMHSSVPKPIGRIVQNQLVEHLEKNQPFADSQNGHRENFHRISSTCHNVMTVLTRPPRQWIKLVFYISTSAFLQVF